MDHLLFDIVNLFGSVGETRLSVSTNLRLSNGAKYQPQTKEVFMAYPIWEGDLDFFMNQELNERISGNESQRGIIHFTNRAESADIVWRKNIGNTQEHNIIT